MIVLLGDTHLPRGSRRLSPRCLEWLRAADHIVHTGDVTSATVLDELARLAPVHAVHGNVDEPELRERLPERLVVELEGIRIGVVHDGGRITGRHARLRGWFPECELIGYGHSHRPELARVGSRWIVNPGSPTERRRSAGHSLAVVESGVPRLVAV